MNSNNKYLLELQNLKKSIEEIEDKEKELLLTHENSPVIFEIYKKEQLANLRNMIQEKVLCALNNGKNPKKKIRAELKNTVKFKELLEKTLKENEKFNNLMSASSFEDIKDLKSSDVSKIIEREFNQENKRKFKEIEEQIIKILKNIDVDELLEPYFDKMVNNIKEQIDLYFKTEKDICFQETYSYWDHYYHNFSEYVSLKEEPNKYFERQLDDYNLDKFIISFVSDNDFLTEYVLDYFYEAIDILWIYDYSELSFAQDEVIEAICNSFIEHDLLSSVEAIFDKNYIISLLKENPHYSSFIKNYEYLEKELPNMILTRIPEKYQDLFPSTRKIQRHFVLHLGPTNSGKTWSALNILKTKSNGVYLGPLRLLAFEKFEELNEQGYPCSLKTGEEQILTKNAIFTSSTIEMADFTQHYDCAIIDEGQMIADTQRGGAWTNAILGLMAKEIHVCAAPEAKDLLIRIIQECNDTWEIIEHERKNELKMDTVPFEFPKSVQKGDALILFSKRDVHAVASELTAKGIKCSIIYGALPYDVRQHEAQRFNKGETDVVVATDAIGMGLNLPIRRVIFLKTEKFDGVEKRNLKIKEYKQIAGRAGRYGIFEEGLFWVYGDRKERRKVKERINLPDKQLELATVTFPENILRINAKISNILKKWQEMTVNTGYIKQDVENQIILAEELEKITNDKYLIQSFISFNFDLKDPEIKEVWLNIFKSELKEETYKIPIDLKFYIQEENSKNKYSLQQLEFDFKVCDLLYQYYSKFNEEYIQQILDIKHVISKEIMKLLSEQKLEKRTCKYCGEELPWNYPYGMCSDCYEAQYGYRNYDWDDDYF